MCCISSISELSVLCKYPIQLKGSSAVRPCSQCLSCRINKRRVWAHRLLLEGLYHDTNVFLTLTYSDENLPSSFVHPVTNISYADFSVNPEHHRLFINKLRTYYARQTGKKLRFYAVGEYGEKTQRPHYHYALFGFPPCTYGAQWHGKKFVPCGCPSCSFISSTWGKGHIFSGTLTSDSANYIAGYVTKKLTSDKNQYAQAILKGRYPEFSRQSRNPGIAGHSVDKITSLLTQYNIITQDQLPRVLLHGSKALPLGRYLSDKLHEKMGLEFEPHEKLENFEKKLRSMLLFNPNAPLKVARAAANGSFGTAMKFLTSQRVIDLETKTRLFTKETSI